MVRLSAVLTLLTFVYAVGLGVTMWALTRDEDQDLAMLAMCCRVSEGVIAAMATIATLEKLQVAIASTSASGLDAAAVTAMGGMLLRQGGVGTPVTAACFAVGSLLFSYLFLRARSIPALLAWLGVIASILLVVVLPAQIAGLVRGPLTQLSWIPMALFEVALAVWLLVKGAAAPRLRPVRSELAAVS